MKLCVISPGVPHAVPRTMAFCENFDDVHFIDMSGDADREKLEAAGIEYYPIGELQSYGANWLRLNRLLRALDPDAIVVHFCSGRHFFAAIAHGRCPVSGIVMGSDVQYELGDKTVPAMRRLLIRLGLRRLVHISAKAKILADRCRRYGAKAPISINYWGADTNVFAPADRAEACRTLGLPASRPIILSPRTLSPLYRIDMIVDAMRTVVQAVPGALLVIVGKAVPDYRQRIEEQIDRAELTNNVRITGPVPFDEIPAWYAAADLVVSMARTEGFPNTILEVMCCKRPIIVGRIPQIEEILVDGVDSRLIPADSDSLAASTMELLEDPNRATALAEAGHRKALSLADIRKNGRRFAEDLGRYVTRGPRTPAPALWAYRLLFFIYAVQLKLGRG